MTYLSVSGQIGPAEFAVGGRSAEARADELLALLQAADTCGYIGEAVSQLEHALQAAELARQAGADDETVLAALFHDIGHLCAPEAEGMDGYGTKGHEELGAVYLSQMGASECVAALVRGHVQAKRYLAYKDESYTESLSEASRQTLQRQGEAMTAKQAMAFERDPLFSKKLLIRRCDDGAKLRDWKVDGLDAYRPMLVEHLRAQAA
ncbi:MAG: HD domain-containing protein [Chlamydiia bacterium]|nr:HD domain-containing protein [Chlamydiia bacterium]